MTSDVGTLDVEAVRAAFPALARVHAGQPVAYFDGPGGTQVPRMVVDAMAERAPPIARGRSPRRPL